MVRFLIWLVASAALLAGPLASPAAGATSGSSNQRPLVVLSRLGDGSLRVETLAPGAVLGAQLADGGRQILAVEPEVIFSTLTDPLRPQQWAFDATTIERVASAHAGTGTVIAVIDTGVRFDHEDLTGQLLPAVDLVDGIVDGSEADHFHGTHVTGIAVAAAGNGRGIHGVAPGATVLPVRALSGSGMGSSATVAAAIIHAADAGVEVINLSLGSISRSIVVEMAIDYAVSRDVVVVAAAGNSGASGNPTIWPAALDNVLSVGATTASGERALYSSHGRHLDLVAPGDGIVSAHHGRTDGYASSSGTSMAAPFVAGVAALVREANPNLTEAETRTVLTMTAIDLGEVGVDAETGFGLVDPEKAVETATALAGADAEPRFMQLSLVTASGSRDPCSVGGTEETISTVVAEPIVGAAAHPGADGYWLVAADGGIFAIGGAPFHGSTGNLTLNQPIAGMAPTPTGNGYWLVAADGGIFAYGDAPFHGSTGNLTLNQPIVGMAPTPTGNGYWLVAADGGIFAYGDAPFHGSGAAAELTGPVRSIVSTADGSGYALASTTGEIIGRGSAYARRAGSVAAIDVVAALPCD